MKYLAISILAVTILGTSCSGDSGDCGDGVVGSESHWANCGNTNVATNNATSNNGSDLDAGVSNNNTNNQTTGNNSTTGNNVVVDAGMDAGSDMGPTDPERCFAFRWDDTTRTFEEARCTAQDDGTFLCSCFDAGDTPSIAVTCPEALAECGAQVAEIEGCAMTQEAGCTATATGWECTCQGIDGVFTSDAERCDSAYYSSCYADEYCVAEIGPGLEGRCTPTLDETYAATGFVCGCYNDGVETIEPFMINRETCAEAAPLACGE